MKTMEENGNIGHFHKNSKHNLVPLWELCHHKVHNENLRIHGYIQTNEGLQLKYEYIDQKQVLKEKRKNKKFSKKDVESILKYKDKDMNKKDMAAILAAGSIAAGATVFDKDIKKAVDNGLLPAKKPYVIVEKNYNNVIKVLFNICFRWDVIFWNKFIFFKIF